MGLGSILGAIGGAIAAPFTGGASLIPSIVSAAAPVAGAAADALLQGRSAGRQQENANNAGYDAARLRAAQLMEEALRSRQILAGQQAGNAVRGDILAGAKPVSVSGPITGTHGRIPQITGGLSPALFSSNTRTLGQNMNRQALLDQMNTPKINIPQPTAPAQSGVLDKILGGVSLAGGLSGLIPKIGGGGMKQPYGMNPGDYFGGY